MKTKKRVIKDTKRKGLERGGIILQIEKHICKACIAKWSEKYTTFITNNMLTFIHNNYIIGLIKFND